VHASQPAPPTPSQWTAFPASADVTETASPIAGRPAPLAGTRVSFSPRD
jgi:hypothetical protein